MKTRRIRLREVTSEDWPLIFAWRNTKNFRYFVRSNDDVVSYSEFCIEFKKAITMRPFQFIVEAVQQCEPVGLAYVHSMAKEGRHCFVNIFILDRYVGRGYGVDVGLLVCSFLLTKTIIERVFLQAFSYNTFSLATLRGARIPEVHTEERRQHDGEEHQVYRFYVTHEHMARITQLLDAVSRSKSATIAMLG